MRGEERNTGGIEGSTSHFPWIFTRFGLAYLKSAAFMRKTGSKTSGLHKYSELTCLN